MKLAKNETFYLSWNFFHGIRRYLDVSWSFSLVVNPAIVCAICFLKDAHPFMEKSSERYVYSVSTCSIRFGDLEHFVVSTNVLVTLGINRLK